MAKLGRETFLYLSPAPDVDEFAQCMTCRDWVGGDDRCCIHGPHVAVYGTMSCGLYVYGAPQPSGTHTLAIVTPEESGLVNREVRCENCIHLVTHLDGNECAFFRHLNEEMPELFDLDVKVEPKGCCNAQQDKA